MRNFLNWAVALAVTCSFTGKSVAGPVLISGLEMNSTIQGYLTAQGYSSTIVPAGSLGSTSFSGYSAIWLSWSTTYGPVSPALTANLLAFMNAGGNVLVEGETNALSFLPGVTGITETGVGGDTVHIVAPTNPVNAGLTDAGLSNWGSSFHTTWAGFDSSFSVLTNNGGTGAVTIEKTFGLGHLVLTGQDISFHIKFGAGATGATSPKGVFENNVLGLAPEAVTAVPEPATLAVFGGIALAGAFGYRRRKTTAGV